MTEQATVDAPEREYSAFPVEVRAASDDDRTFEFLATTERRDRAGDELTLSGWDFKAYRENPVVVWNHGYGPGGGPEAVIGRTLAISKETVTVKGKKREGYVFKVKFVEEDVHPYGEMVLKLVKRGYLRAVSVGYLTKQMEWIEESEEERKAREKDSPALYPNRRISKKELIELSITPIGMNPDALLVNRKSLELPPDLSAHLDRHLASQKAVLETTRRIKAELRAIEGEAAPQIEITDADRAKFRALLAESGITDRKHYTDDGELEGDAHAETSGDGLGTQTPQPDGPSEATTAEAPREGVKTIYRIQWENH